VPPHRAAAWRRAGPAAGGPGGGERRRTAARPAPAGGSGRAASELLAPQPVLWRIHRMGQHCVAAEWRGDGGGRRTEPVENGNPGRRAAQPRAGRPASGRAATSSLACVRFTHSQPAPAPRPAPPPPSADVPRPATAPERRRFLADPPFAQRAAGRRPAARRSPPPPPAAQLACSLLNCERGQAPKKRAARADGSTPPTMQPHAMRAHARAVQPAARPAPGAARRTRQGAPARGRAQRCAAADAPTRRRGPPPPVARAMCHRRRGRRTARRPLA